MRAERVLAPLAVLALHTALLANVAAHRGHLTTWSLRALLEWALAFLAVILYLRTVCCDPGVLKRPSARAWSEPQPIGRAQLDALEEEDVEEDLEEEVIRHLANIAQVPEAPRVLRS